MAGEAVLPPGPIWNVVPQRFRAWLDAVDAAHLETLEEIRFRVGRPIALYGHDWSGWLSPHGLVAKYDGLPATDADLLNSLLEIMADRSLYAREHELRQGYLTLPGGHRVGLAGRAVMTGDEVSTVRNVAGINLRVARAVCGAATEALALMERHHPFDQAPSILFISRPRAGKTTVLRDTIAQLSQQGFKVVAVDERSEIAVGAADEGFGLGPHTDVLMGWPKGPGIDVAIRVLGPDIVAVDEIGSQRDVEALERARRAGVGVVATAHAGSPEDARRQPGLRDLLNDGVFDWLVELERRDRPGRVRTVRRL